MIIRNSSNNAFKIVYRLLQSFVQRDMRLPIQMFFCKLYDGLALERVVGRKGTVYDFGFGLGKGDDFLRKLQDRKFPRIAQIAGAGKIGGGGHQAHHTLNQIVHIAETSCLGTVSIDRNILIF